MENMELKSDILFDNIYAGKRVLITGDTGFKGSWLAIWLLELGADVYGYALPPLTERDNFVKTSLALKIKHKNGDIRDTESLLSYFKEVKPEIAFHLAAQPLVLESYNNPRYTFETNLMGTVNFFEAVRKTTSVKAAVNITSDKCYQNNEWVWGYRESDPMGGKDPYSASKGAAEIITYSYITSFFSENGTPAVASARAGNVIGGGDWAENRIVPDFFRALIESETLKIRNPYATRPWQHVLEPLNGYLLLASKLYRQGKNFTGGWNFGPIGAAHYTVEKLISSMITLMDNGKYKALINQTGFHEAHLLKLDISKAIHCLNWRPILNFKETVKFTVEGYNSELKNKDVYASRIEQIKEFTRLSNERNNF